ncbi:ras association domain-containing protein 9-like isoform X2 [Mustelus asterias]
MGSPEGAQISVWVCQEEKVVCGLTKRTSCAQVVRALLKDHLANTSGGTRLLHAAPGEYCIVEKWRGFERLLPSPTKLLRLWLSWGEEQPNVHLVLVKWGASVPVPGLRAAEARVVQSQGEMPSPAQYMKRLPAEKQKRMVRKAFKKLARMKRLRQGREGMETLVHLIVSQDHTIRQQLQRMRELDGDIDCFQSRMHWERIQKEGENYVQETYLLEGREDQQSQQLESKRETLLQLEGELQQHRKTIHKLSQDIEQELRQAWETDTQEEGQEHQAPSPDQEQAETQRVQGDLEKGMHAALQLREDFQDIQEQVRLQEASLRERAEECESLARQLEALSLAEEAERAAPLPGPGKDLVEKWPPDPGSAPCGSSSHPLSPSDVNDTDSDTGISSTHSQDSEPPCVEVLPTAQNYL